MATSVKVKIDVGMGVIEVDGPEEFVKEILEKYNKEILAKSNVPKKMEKLPKKVVVKERKVSIKSTNITEPLNTLIESGFLDDYKYANNVMEELKKKGIPNVSIQNITTALYRKLGNGLEREQDEKKKWRYIKSP
jgi:hypothetical protein